MADRALIVEQCRQAPSVRSSSRTAPTRWSRPRGPWPWHSRPVGGKTIVLTGAMVPYAFGSSDGLFNLGSALSFVQVLPPGVYVAMNGRWFAWDRVRKNTDTGTFEEAPTRLTG